MPIPLWVGRYHWMVKVTLVFVSKRLGLDVPTPFPHGSRFVIKPYSLFSRRINNFSGLVNLSSGVNAHPKLEFADVSKRVLFFEFGARSLELVVIVLFSLFQVWS